MMKKIFATALVVFSGITVINAQDHFQLGIKTGFTSTQYTTDNVKNASAEWPNYQGIKDDAKSGFLFGAYARVKLVGNLSLQPELYYIKKSGEAQYNTGTGGILTQDIDIHTWDVPILLHFNIIDVKVAKLYGLTGPVISFVANNSTSLKGYGEDDVKKASWGYQLGAGLEVWKLNLDARYEWGLSNVSTGLSDVEFNRKGKMLMISLGYRLIGF